MDNINDTMKNNYETHFIIKCAIVKIDFMTYKYKEKMSVEKKNKKNTCVV